MQIPSATHTLPTDYYRENFLTLIHTVEAQYPDLLNEAELAWLHTFLSLPIDSQRLYLRLLTRKGPLFRLTKLRYEEIADIDAAATQLADVNFITFDVLDYPLDTVCALFTKPELLHRFECLQSIKQAKKTQLVETLCAQGLIAADFCESLIAICHSTHLRVFLLLFFGNTHQDLSQFVLADLGLHTFESYPLDRAHRFFSDREQIDDWLALSDLNETLWQAKAEKDLHQVIELVPHLPTPFTWAPLERKRQTLINHIARDIERIAGESTEQQAIALSLYRQTQRPPSRERQIRLLDKRQQWQEALALTQTILDSPHNEEEADVAQTLYRRLAKKAGLTAPKKSPPSYHALSLVLPQGTERVEHTVAEYFKQQGWHAEYVENTLMCGLFGLAFWDLIFSPLPGAFINPFQRSPKDMFSEAFFAQRRDAIERRLVDIEQGVWQEWLSVYQQKFGISNDWVHWSALSEALLLRAIHVIPPSALCVIFSRILFDPKHNRSGFPDLILFQEDTYQWVEVKGPGDTLQRNQLRWLQVFDQHDIPALVAFITWEQQADID
ncbi:VRR-NUC domain-containing protein [Photobacterium aphoticum]|uniref:phosphodiesterase I n=1 Tax=Photobacterium aphoticum TaxID=754436 RepID=A0A0J1GTM6_9GAMM|nr:VRR-NUC domain-containing protein [Photobacterium aphoticum]KLV03090.1 hypothetical protein ABT58_00795 [Photobacterium aphoticum]GHA52125.1 nuclease [Photobacterium aphoticum]